jgi:hypothetical protein
VTQPELSAKERFDELIVWYVNGTLEPQDRRWVEDYLRDHPDSYHELDWHGQLKEASDIQNMEIPPSVGLRGLLEQVRADKAKQSNGLLARILGGLASLNTRPAFAFAAVLVLAQAVALGFLTRELRDRDQIISRYSATRGIPGQAPLDLPTLQVTFKSSATEREIRLLLVSIQGTIVDGPKQLGGYTVAVRTRDPDEARMLLEGSAIVELVSLQKSPAVTE